MSVGSETTNCLETGDNLHQQVLASLPPCDVTEEVLTQNPQFCKLLATLTQHLDKSGLTVQLKADLDRAEQKLQSQKRQWLRAESLYRGLQEMIQEFYVQKHKSTVPPDQNMEDATNFSGFYETMERCLRVTQCAKQLEPSSTTSQDQPSVLGLTPQQVLQLLPSEKNVQQMKQALPTQLERHLKEKCLSLVSYYQPEWENESEGLKTNKLSHLSTLLDKDKKRTELLKETCRENTVLLQRQTQLYLSELIKCIQLFQTLLSDHRLKIQTDLDGKKLNYLEGKCEIVFQKIKTEMEEIQLDTYSLDTISAHRKIREKLESELTACKAEKQALEMELPSFEVLGKDFKALAEEYFRLRQEIDMKNWALKELTKYNEK
ncbi:HAUS augmin-like complex subunit 4 isoform X2 [Poeciliopsis prolifica]|uniref:HAUS augmin-like complex subunit 4 isoform X2 n=1 Tax=Poeciliopsis prolifica TaxID=188132 RepID=UPI00241425A1|nr:HAUS augmin-like complex subunit 4 isoform X2 [Poeciliopsis prolifica]